MTQGRTITVFAARSGCGKTVLATNLAVVLSAGGRRVCLVDLDFDFGDAAVMLGLPVRRSLADAVRTPQKAQGALPYDGLSVAAAVTLYRPGLDCLLAPETPGEADQLPIGLLSGLLRFLPRKYDFVIIDTPGGFSAMSLAALDVADQQVLVSTAERTALKGLRRVLDVFDLLPYDRDRRRVVINRTDSRVDLPPADVEALIRNPVALRLPASIDVPASVNHGVPLAIWQPAHPLSRAVHQLADQITTADGKCRQDPPA
jgi:pilus assembly protein CpaE